VKYRKKPVVIEALQFTGDDDGVVELVHWLNEIGAARDVVTINIGGGEERHSVSIKTLEGTMIAGHGDWIICGIRGELYPCKPDIFEATYEAEL